MEQFKLGLLYDICFKYKYSINRFERKETEISLKKQMFYKSTACYYVFWNTKEYVRVLKQNLIRATLSN